MAYITARDGAQIFYKEGGTGHPIVFSHGWPLNADAWDAQMLFLGRHGTASSRTIAAPTAAPPRHGMATRWTPTPTT